MESGMSLGRAELLRIAETVAQEKGISAGEVLDAMEQAVQTAARRKYGQEHEIVAEIDRKTGDIRIYRELEISETVDDYTKQIQQFKTDKTASAEERKKMEDENKLLQGIVMRVLQEDANRSQRKKMVQKELDRLQVQSDVLLKQINFLTEPVVKLSSAERRLFKRPIIDVQDPNTIVAIKTDTATEPAPGAPASAATLVASGGAADALGVRSAGGDLPQPATIKRQGSRNRTADLRKWQMVDRGSVSRQLSNP